MALVTGQVLNNRYRIVNLLGQGGMGAVYKVWDLNLKRPRALKENLDTSPEAQRQFEREALMLADLSHPNLPKVSDYFFIPGQGQYLVMEFVEGEDLGEKLQRAGGPLPEAQVLDWIGQACTALEYLHTQNPPVIHRDIKPANIKITTQGGHTGQGCLTGQGKAMLVDFGIAKLYDPRLSTTAGAKAVTPGYSPLEQYGSGVHTTPATDIYALGATLYSLLTGQTPPQAPDRNLGLALIPPRALNPAISAALEATILRALAVLPGDRFQSASEFAAALRLAATPAPYPVPVTVITPQASGAAYAGAPAAYPAAQTLAVPAARRKMTWIWIVGIVAFLALSGWAATYLAGRGRQPSADRTATAFSALLGPLTPSPFLFTPTSLFPMSLPFTRTPPSFSPTALSDTPLFFTSTPILGIGSTMVSLLDGMAMVYVPAGEFLMGSADSDPKAEDNEKPQHTVYLDAYWIDRTEVTNAQYALCVEAGKCQPPVYTSSKTRSSYYGDVQFDDYPVSYLNWDAAVAYCSWAGRRLPTEAEWEKATRGTDGRLYPWGNQDPTCQLVNYNRCVGDTSMVGSYPAGASPYGALDMAGNVWEWVQDFYSGTYYPSSPASNPLGPASSESSTPYRVLRGGFWGFGSKYVRAAYRTRGMHLYDINDGNYGVRCALSSQANTPATQLPSSPTIELATASSSRPPAVAQLGATWTRPADGMDMLFIPAGEFLMGTAAVDATEPEEMPQHTVYLDAYWIDQTEVTNAQYARCVTAGECQPPANTTSATRSSYYGDGQYEDYPVIYVSWDEANAYCTWAGGRLPTEAEWEKAARGENGQIYPWGNQKPTCNLLNYNGFCVGDTTVVGSYLSGASPYGALDMAGNVWEWVADWWDENYYQTGPTDNPSGPASGQYRGLRGGSWDAVMWYAVRAALRDKSDPSTSLDNIGFRCSASL